MKTRCMMLVTTVMMSAAVTMAAEAAPDAPEQKPAKVKRTKFQILDLNHDGKISLDEYKNQVISDADAKFAAADSNKDGGLSEEEFMAARKADQEKVRVAKRAERAAAKAAKDPAVPAVPANSAK